jgi:23S rRNA pseudouridine1911/1915/1917 synthase
MLNPGSVVTLSVCESDNGVRIDTVISKMIGSSRTLIQEFITLGVITVDTVLAKKNSMPVFKGQQIVILVPQLHHIQAKGSGDKSILDTVMLCAQEDDFIIINKPAGLVVHAPNRKSREPSLVDWLTDKGYLQGFEGLVRPGIVHRLDKETSGIMIVAKNRTAHGILSDLFKERKIKKKYYAIVHGNPPEQMRVDSFLVRDPMVHIKMVTVPYSYHHDSTRTQSGFKRAISEIKKIKQLGEYALLQVTPLTGRTHQIRVHCASLGYPIVGDALYGTKSELINRHALHAFSLAFEYQGTSYEFQVPISDDINRILESI